VRLLRHPSAVRAAVSAAQLGGVRPAADVDRGDVGAAAGRALINTAVELNAEGWLAAQDTRLGTNLRRPSVMVAISLLRAAR
jgi:hypothetical protein